MTTEPNNSAEQVAGLQARVDAAETSLKTRDAEYMRGAQMLVESATTWQERAEAAEKQLTAAQEELASTVKAFESFQEQSWATRDQLQTQLTALQSALAQKEKDGELLKASCVLERLAEQMENEGAHILSIQIKETAWILRNRDAAARTARSEPTPAAKE